MIVLLPSCRMVFVWAFGVGLEGAAYQGVEGRFVVA